MITRTDGHCQGHTDTVDIKVFTSGHDTTVRCEKRGVLKGDSNVFNFEIILLL